MTTPACPSYAGRRFPAEIISHAVWLCFCFPPEPAHGGRVAGRARHPRQPRGRAPVGAEVRPGLRPQLRPRLARSAARLLAPRTHRACGPARLRAACGRSVAGGLAAALAGKLGKVAELPPGLATVARDLGTAAAGACSTLAGALRRAFAPDPPASLAEPGFIAKGYDKRLDACRAKAARAKEAIEALQARYVGDTGVKSLRIRVNSVIGHHVEVPASSAQALDPGFTLRQGLASSTRFTTPELDSLAAALEEASAQPRRAEQAAFMELSAAAMASREALTRIAHAAAALDLVAGLAQAAAEGHWSEPELVGDTGLDIEGGRHCLVPGSRGATLTREGEEALWQAVLTAQPGQRREFGPSSKRRKKRLAS